MFYLFLVPAIYNIANNLSLRQHNKIFNRTYDVATWSTLGAAYATTALSSMSFLSFSEGELAKITSRRCGTHRADVTGPRKQYVKQDNALLCTM